jgi:hypothetical protein
MSLAAPGWLASVPERLQAASGSSRASASVFRVVGFMGVLLSRI